MLIAPERRHARGIANSCEYKHATQHPHTTASLVQLQGASLHPADPQHLEQSWPWKATVVHRPMHHSVSHPACLRAYTPRLVLLTCGIDRDMAAEPRLCLFLTFLLLPELCALDSLGAASSPWSTATPAFASAPKPAPSPAGASDQGANPASPAPPAPAPAPAPPPAPPGLCIAKSATSGVAMGELGGSRRLAFLCTHKRSHG